MGSIRSEIKFYIEGEELDLDKMLNKAKSSIFSIKYNDSEFKNTNMYELNTKCTININNNICGVYFIYLNDDTLVYIGKSNHISNRLKEHLIKCSKSTSSHIKNVKKYLEEYDNNKTIKYSFLACNNMDTAVCLEQLLINKYNPQWNTRKS